MGRRKLRDATRNLNVPDEEMGSWKEGWEPKDPREAAMAWNECLDLRADFTERVFDKMMDRSLPIPCAKEWRVWVEKIDRLAENYRAYLSEEPEGSRTIPEALQRDRKWATEMWENRKGKGDGGIRESRGWR
jgi:hypothetical protein